MTESVQEYLTPAPGYDWKCRRCGHEWCYRGPRVDHPVPPRQCAGCRSAYWNQPRSNKVTKTRPVKKPKVDVVHITEIAEYPPDVPPHPLLKPPPHLRNRPYYPPEPEPQPENMITRDTIPDWEEPDDNGAVES